MNKKLYALMLCYSTHAFSLCHSSQILEDSFIGVDLGETLSKSHTKVFSGCFDNHENSSNSSEKDLNKSLSNNKTPNQSTLFETNDTSDYWMRGFYNITQMFYGEQTAPSTLHTEINKLIAEDQWSSSEKVVKPFSGQEITLYKSMKRSDGSTFVVTAPGHDISDNNPMAKASAGEISVKEIIDRVLKDNPSGKVEVCTPVAQANRFWGLFKRNHWTTLNLSIEDGKILNAKLIDSKGWLSSLYGGGVKIQNQLPENSPQVETVYTGHQGLLNNKDCGRFAATYIMARAENKKIETMPTKQVTGFFSRFNLWK